MGLRAAGVAITLASGAEGVMDCQEDGFMASAKKCSGETRAGYK